MFELVSLLSRPNQGDSSVAILLSCASVVSHVAFVLSFALHFGALGGLCLVIVAFTGYLHLYSLCVEHSLFITY